MTALPRICLIGEGMLELSRDGDGNARLGYGGDTLNTAVYLARLGLSPDYVTAVGSDPYSDRMLKAWEAEGVVTAHVVRHPSRLSGLYAIETDGDGERSFFYWRDTSAARDFFNIDGHEDALRRAATSDWLYLSGITLSLFTAAERERLSDVAAAVVASGGEVVFDPNYRPTGWPSADAARTAMEAFCRHATILLPTGEDEMALFSLPGTPPDAAHWQDLGARVVVMKRGADGASVFEAGKDPVHVPVPEAVPPVDTTGAGDSFNAGFMAAAIRGLALAGCVRAGHALAGRVVQHRGAIIPAAAMPVLF